MKKFRVRNKIGGYVVWEGETLSADFALIRAAKTLGFEKLGECRAQAGVSLTVEEVRSGDQLHS